ncbi:SDR family oxidoreductase [Candidatus Woesearchaeota archaeon]|nr:SDR family oxidoreductase [Candidatus Woesearchaeota archaeon]MCF7900813.1 SDR family oxidoreductase [Candidatus Woesearchaeota archaeon]MCF8013115.1 SDR family oxidoreductase [Candidatus Woesearchaeota archaeon]
MNLELKGKKALITGAGRGLGASIAINLAKEGVQVAIISRSKSDLNLLIKKMDGEGHYAFECDLLEENSAKTVVEDIQKNFGNVEILINNVGGTLNIKDPFCSIEDWRKVWKLNMETTIEFTNLLSPHMINQSWGRIVNISSISSLENQGPVTYCSVKAALTAYTRSMGRVLSAKGVVMTSVLPGAVFTEGGYWDITSKKDPEHVKKYLSERMSIGRFGKVDEIGSVVTFLCSNQASFFVGSAILVDGGQGKCFNDGTRN